MRRLVLLGALLLPVAWAADAEPLPTPADACPGPFVTTDEETACFTRYLADRAYESQTTGFGVTAVQLAPLAALLMAGSLGVWVARGGR